MKSKNILISIGVLVIGVILYKILLGFVLPIALFVSLGYVLKFLLKGSDSDGGQEASQILRKEATTASIENIVEIKPIEEKKPFSVDTLSEEDSPSEENTLSIGDPPSKENVSSADEKPNEEVNIS